MFFIYVLESIAHKRYYTGCTANIDRRLMQHNLGNVKSTKSYKPWKVVYTETFITKSEAFRREQQIKSYKSGDAFKKLIENTERWQSG
ncbi:MAG: hypothetical protein BMS9Abin39_0674 [Ignavibacteria bacterium]|nr:MAG: hypothetical protein BMS9Abin39_0674 [Ignavibacteria bacterium]